MLVTSRQLRNHIGEISKLIDCLGLLFFSHQKFFVKSPVLRAALKSAELFSGRDHRGLWNHEPEVFAVQAFLEPTIVT